ncbi:MAG: hypothetical protein J6M05_00415 [Cardiobacteriaceae bacterium]|nr:hypothetical protein [Cardiobacteriaceae bacterium]
MLNLDAPNNKCYEYIVTIPNGQTGGFADQLHMYAQSSNQGGYLYKTGVGVQSWQGMLELGDGYFKPTSDAKTIDEYHGLCDGEYEWSGNAMNFMTMSALDIFRQALTGGNRAKGVGGSKKVYEDGDADTTYLRRAMFWNGTESTKIFPYGSSLGNAADGSTANQKNDDAVSRQRKFANDIVQGTIGNEPAIDYLVPKGFRTSLEQIKKGEFEDPYGVPKNLKPNYEKTASDFSFFMAGTGFYVALYGDIQPSTYAINGARRIYQTPRNTARTSIQNGQPTQARWFNVVVEQQNRPTGLLQQLGTDGGRTAVIGYLPELKAGSESGDGGVLRAGMRNVVEVEVESDGKFKPNPDNDSSGNSGVINYVNKFGDNSLYDSMDPVSELYYTAVRYLRNGAWKWTSDGSQERVAGDKKPYTLPTNLKPYQTENFPVIREWDDPLHPEGKDLSAGKCYAPMIITIGDTSVHYDGNLPNYPGNSVGTDNTALDKDGTHYYAKVAELQGHGTGEYAWRHSSGIMRAQDSEPTFGMAGIAYWLKTNDVRPDITAASKDKTPMHISSLFVDVLQDGHLHQFDASSRLAQYGAPTAAMCQEMQKTYPYKACTIFNYYNSLTTNQDNKMFNAYWLAGKFGAFNYTGNTPLKTADFSSKNEEMRDIWASSTATEDELKLFPLGIPKGYLLANNPENMVKGLTEAFSYVNESFKYTSQSHDTFNVRSPVTSENILDFTKQCSSTTLYTGVKPVQGSYLPNAYICNTEENLLWNSKFNLSGNYGTVTGKYIDLARKQDGNLDLETIQEQLKFGGDSDQVNDYPLLEQDSWTTDSWTSAKLMEKRKTNLYTKDGVLTSDMVTSNIDGVSASDLYNWLIGDTSKEARNKGGTLRNREKLLGTVVNSSVTGVFHLTTDHLKPYHYATKFRADSCKFPDGALIRRNHYGVAANDGIFHILEALHGDEIYGFLPQPALAKLSDIARNDNKFHYANDGFSIYFDYCSGDSAKSMLVGSTGRGGNSVYAIDMTTPENPRFKWEFPYSVGTDHQADVGYTVPSPVKALFDIDDKPVQKVIVSSGYSNTSGKGSIFFIDADNGKTTQIPLSADGVTAPAGVGEPFAYDENSDGVTDVVYVGDFAGNLWKIDLIDRSSDEKKPKTSGWKAELLYKADADAQPITGAPSADTVRGQTVVVFGTGHYFTADGVRKDVQNYAYGIYDSLDESGKTITVTSSDIIEHQLDEPPSDLNASGRLLHSLKNAVCVNGTCGASLDSIGEVNSKTGQLVTLNAKYKGWRLELDKGRTIAANSQIIEGNYGKYAYFVGVKNESVNVDKESCDLAYGTTGVIALNLLTGGTMERVFDTNMDTTIDDKDETGVIMDIPNALSPSAAGVVFILPEISDKGTVIGQRTAFATGIRDSEGNNRMIMTDYKQDKHNGVFIRTSLREIRAISR